MDKKTILGLKLAELKEKCEQLNLGTSGNKKAIFQEKLFKHFKITENVEESVEEIVEDEEEEEDENEEFVEARDYITPANFTLRDIQDSMSYFDGSGNPEVNQWITEFEENARSVQWSVFSKQLLRGAAQMFVRSQNNLNNY